MKLWKHSGTFLFATGVIHNLIGLIKGWEVLKNIAADGFLSAIGTDMSRRAIFWFLITGIMMMLQGKSMQDFIDTHQRPAPLYFGYTLLAITVIGCLMMPVSGFWIVLPQALIIIVAHLKKESLETVVTK